MRMNFLSHRMRQCRMRCVTNYIGAHLDEPISLEDLAHKAHFSPAHLVRAYREATGESPMHTVRRLRLCRAYSRLAQGDYARVTDIGFEAGYGSSAAFTHAFQRAFGVAPIEVPTRPAGIEPPPVIRLEHLPEREVWRFAYDGVFGQNGWYKARLSWLCYEAGRPEALSWRLNDRDHPFTEDDRRRVCLDHFIPVAELPRHLAEPDRITQAAGLYAVVRVCPTEREGLLAKLEMRVREELGCAVVEGRTMDRDIHERSFRVPQERRVEVLVPVTPLDARGRRLAELAIASTRKF